MRIIKKKSCLSISINLNQMSLKIFRSKKIEKEIIIIIKEKELNFPIIRLQINLSILSILIT